MTGRCGPRNFPLGPGSDSEIAVGMDEADGVACPEGGVAQCIGQEVPADAGGPHQQDVLVFVQERQRGYGLQQAEVQGSLTPPCCGISMRWWALRLTPPLGMTSKEGGAFQLLPAGQDDAPGQDGSHGSPAGTLFERGSEAGCRVKSRLS